MSLAVTVRVLVWRGCFLTLWCAACGSADRDGSPGRHTPETPSVATAKTAPAPYCANAGHPRETAAERLALAEPVSWRDDAASRTATDLARVKLLGFNDFHGHLTPTVGVSERPLGGAAVLAAYFRDAMRGAWKETLILHAGDLIGASPPQSALFGDEPSVAFLNTLCHSACARNNGAYTGCHVIAALGNHELDDGVDALMRLLNGGDRSRAPTPLGTPFTGARFPMLAANVVDAASGAPLLAPFKIVSVGGVSVGVIGAVLAEAGVYLTPSRVASIRFQPVTPAIQAAVDRLTQQGVQTIVVALHQGGRQVRSTNGTAVKGPVADLVAEMDPAVDVVISGHSHTGINGFHPNRGGRPTLVTQAFSGGTAFADIDLYVDKQTGEVVTVSSRIVTTWADRGPGAAPDARVAKVLAPALAAVADKTTRVMTTTTAAFSDIPNCDGESALGSLIADAQRAALKTDVALIQPAWIRTGLPAGPVTWGDLFAVQPFGDEVVRLQMTGGQLVDLLNQQWLDRSHARIFNVSGMSFAYDRSRPVRDRIVEVRVGGQPVDENAPYTAAVNAYLAEGGDGYSVLTSAKRLDGTVRDIDAFAKHVQSLSRPLTPRIEGRVRNVTARRNYSETMSSVSKGSR